jgi:NitT/TauT family transport system substrate-binding protein
MSIQKLVIDVLSSRLETCLPCIANQAAIACRRGADDMPFENRLIDFDAVPEAAPADCAAEPLGSRLLHHVPWTEAEYSISAIVTDEQAAPALIPMHMRSGTGYAIASPISIGRNPRTSKGNTAMRSLGIFAATAAFLVSAPAVAEDVKVGIGISGWTGFAPLTLANQAGIFKKNGLDVTIKKIPQKDRHLAIASGDVQCAATTVETWISWNANGVATKQIFQLDKSYGADGMATRNDVASIKDLKGKTVAASAPGTAPYFTLAWMLKKNGLSVKDVTVVNLEPAGAAQAFVAGQNDAAMTYEPYLSTVRAAPDKGKIIATTLDYPMIMDTFGCTPKFLADNPKAAKALADSYFEAIAMIEKDQPKSYEIMGADVKQSGEQFGNSAKYLRWQDKAANQKFFTGEFLAFNKEAADLLLEIGIIKSIPKIDDLFDASFIK